MPGLSLEDAEKRLRAFGDFEWVLDSQKRYWTATEIEEELKKRVPTTLTDRQIRYWFEEFTVLDFGRLGVFARREDVIVMLAEKVVRMPTDESDKSDDQPRLRSAR